MLTKMHHSPSQISTSFTIHLTSTSAGEQRRLHETRRSLLYITTNIVTCDAKMEDEPGGWQAGLAARASTVQVLMVSSKRIGTIIGHGGSRIAEIKATSGAQVHIDTTGSTTGRKVTVWGEPAAVMAAVDMVKACETNSADAPFRNKTGGDKVVVEVPSAQVGIVIGRSGANIRDLQQRSGAEMWVETADSVSDPCTPGMRRVFIVGTPEIIELAKHNLSALLDSNSLPGSHRRETNKAIDSGPRVHDSAIPTATVGGLPEVMNQYFTEELTITDGAFATLLDPSSPGPLAQLQASGLQIHFSRARTAAALAVPPPPPHKWARVGGDEIDADGGAEAGKGEGEKTPSASYGDSSGDDPAAGSGTCTVRLTGPSLAVVHGAKVVLAGCETHAAAAKAMLEQRTLSEEEAMYQYYAPFYARAGLAYAPPTRLWQDDVDKEALRYRMWARYYASGASATADPAASAAAGKPSATGRCDGDALPPTGR